MAVDLVDGLEILELQQTTTTTMPLSCVRACTSVCFLCEQNIIRNHTKESGLPGYRRSSRARSGYVSDRHEANTGGQNRHKRSSRVRTVEIRESRNAGSSPVGLL
jgi:hypothetical protein